MEKVYAFFEHPGLLQNLPQSLVGGIPPKWGIGILRFRDQAPGVGVALR